MPEKTESTFTRRTVRVRELAEMSGLSAASIRNLIAEKKLKGFKVGRSILIPIDEVDRLLAGGR